MREVEGDPDVETEEEEGSGWDTEEIDEEEEADSDTEGTDETSADERISLGVSTYKSPIRGKVIERVGEISIVP